MSPTPIIELQRSLSIIGSIRAGEKGPKGAPKRLENWRLTSHREDLIIEAAGLYGGKPKAWESPTGPAWEVLTTSPVLPVLVIPGYSLRQVYEQWKGPTQCLRRCDGEEEMLSGEPCLCNAAGKEECELYTRLTVALPELSTLLGWQLRTQGQNAARELRGSLQLLEGIADGKPFVPARLQLTERRGAVNGQAVRYVVPILDAAIGYSTLALAAPIERPALEAGYTPVSGGGNGVSVDDGLLAVSGAKPETSRGRAAAPIGPALDPGSEATGPIPVPSEDPGVPSSPLAGPQPVPGAAPQAATDPGTKTPSAEKSLTQAQAKKLNVLVGTLREKLGAISTEQLYSALATSRNVDVTVMIDLTKDAYDTAGKLHWAPLRETLTRAEASDLIERLQRLEENQKAAV